MIIVMGEFRLNPESIEILRNEIAEVIKKSNQFLICYLRSHFFLSVMGQPYIKIAPIST